jgi:hypothetical protein
LGAPKATSAAASGMSSFAFAGASLVVELNTPITVKETDSM